MLDVVAHICLLTTRMLKQEDSEFKVSVGYVVRCHLK